MLYAAIRKYGVPESLVSDSGGVFRSHDAMRIYEALGIQKVEIDKRQAWQSYIETKSDPNTNEIAFGASFTL